MPAVLVHGVPDTPALWQPVLARLARGDVIAPALPGFGCPRPADFPATKEAYADWLVAELEAVGEPVDLVGHDWGSILVLRVASVRPDLVRTLACGGGPIDRDYVWHDMAQAWQTPGVGEDVMATMLTMDRDTLAIGLEAGGSPEELARLQAARVDETMAGCILDLYRSAVTVGEEWQPALDVMRRRPAHVIWGGDDPYVSTDVGARIAARLHAPITVLDCAHWWPWACADETAHILESLWRSAD